MRWFTPKRPGAPGADRLYIAQVASDGTRTNPTCLSCTQTNPPVTTYKNAASLRPQGDWIMVRVEDASGPVISQSQFHQPYGSSVITDTTPTCGWLT